MTTDYYANIKKKLAKDRSLLYFDIETRPMKAWIWHPGKQYVTHEQIAEESKVISIQWMFEGDAEVSWLTWDAKQDDREMLTKFREAIHGAKVAISQNGKSFDHKVLNWRMCVQNLPPMDRVTIFDTLTLSRAAFRPPSHKLDYRSKAYGLGGKLRMHLPDWIDVVERRPGALSKMVRYGCKDIQDLREIFWRELRYYKKLPAELTLLLNPKPEKTQCRMCAAKRQSKFQVVPINKKNKEFYQCQRCSHTWEK